MKMKHYMKTPQRGADKKIDGVSTQCGQIVSWDRAAKASTVSKVTCPECILALLTSYENKICMLEEMYTTLWPGRPIGEKIQ